MDAILDRLEAAGANTVPEEQNPVDGTEQTQDPYTIEDGQIIVQPGSETGSVEDSTIILPETTEIAPPVEEEAPPSYTDLPLVRLQSLDKVTARTMTFDVRVGNTVRFGPLYIRPQACREPPSDETPESAAFLQIWQKEEDESEWIFSGWMFASSPSLSPMDHPVFDVWVLDCMSDAAEEVPVPAVEDEAAVTEDTEEAVED